MYGYKILGIYIVLDVDESLSLGNPEAIEEAIGFLERNSLILKIEKDLYLLVWWNKFFGWHEENMAGTAITNQELEEEMWRMSCGYGELWNSMYAEFFECGGYKWCRKNFYGGPKTALIWNSDVIKSCDTLKARYCKCSERVIQSAGWCKQGSILKNAMSD